MVNKRVPVYRQPVAEEASGNDLAKIISCTAGSNSSVFVDVSCRSVVNFDDAHVESKFVNAVTYLGRKAEERRDFLVAVPSAKYR